MLTIIEKVIFLQNIDVFSEVQTEHLALLASVAEEVTYKAGETLYEINDPPDALYLVLTGRVRLHRGEETIAESGPKEALGVWALFDDSPRVVSATVLEDSELLRIDHEDFVDLMADHVQIAQGVLKTVVTRLRGLAGRVS